MSQSADQSSTEVHGKAASAQGLSPMLIGMTSSVLVLALIAPAALRHGHLITTALLVPMLITCVGLYTWSVLRPGPIVGLQIDTKRRMLELIQANAFAEKRRPVEFSEVHSIAASVNYDRDGYATQHTTLTLKNGETLNLDLHLDEGHMRELRRVVGLAA